MSLPQHVISILQSEFTMTGLGSLYHFLGIVFTKDQIGKFLAQQKYPSEILDHAQMTDYKPTRTPTNITTKFDGIDPPVSDLKLHRNLVGALQYLRFTHLTISYVVEQVSLYMHDPWEPHFATLKHILRYIRGTIDHGLQLFTS